MKNAYLKKVRNDAFVQGQQYNNVQWQQRIQRLESIKGIGSKRMKEIIKELERPLNKGEREAVDIIYQEQVTRTNKRRT